MRFRALRTIPAMIGICRAMQRETKVKVTGLCHSVQGTAHMLASWIGAPMNEVTYLCAGINHQAWYVNFKWNGKDAYPLIREAVTTREDVYNHEQVRNEMFLHLGYYVTESSGHNSEYVAWFRKRPELIEKYCKSGTGWNPGEYAYILNHYLEREKSWRNNIQAELDAPINLGRGGEYASSIFNATIGDGTMFEFNGNVRNFGLVDNLPTGCCVEVPVIASKRGLDAVHVGPLPPQCAALTGLSAQIEEMAVEGIVTGNKDKVYHAIYMDPLTSAVCSLAEIKSMVDEMFEANKDYWRYGR